MASLPDSIVELINSLKKLPGIGPRSAERIALHLVQTDAAQVNALAQLLVSARKRICICSRCGGLAEQEVCSLCSSAQRDSSCLCIVEKPVDILSIEKAGSYRGQYHVLGGKISPINGIGPEDLRIAELASRFENESIGEVIIALGADIEGDVTCQYLAKKFAGKGIRFSKIAHGLPVGGGLEFADELTLSRALEGRQEIQ
jgi:recombination protein RecR